MTRTIHTVRLEIAKWADAPAQVVADLTVDPDADLQIDVANVTAIPALTAQILLAAQRRVTANGGRFGLTSVSDRLRSGLALLGMEHLIQEAQA